MSWKTSPLVTSEILGLFGNTFTADRMYSRHRLEKLPQQVQTLLCENRFQQFLFHFSNLHKILLILEKNIYFIV